jgi:phosphotransferase system enzyme I (PtsI)
VQYTLAVDRTNERVAQLFTAAHPAILHLIREVVRVGRRHKVPVSICGEIAGDPEFTLLLLGLGLRHFSCTPLMIPEIKKIIRSVTIRRAQDVARRVNQFKTVGEIKGYLRKVTYRILPQAYE